MANCTDKLLKLREFDPTVADVMDIYREAAKVHEQALIAMGQQPVAAHTAVASTEIVMSKTPDLSSTKQHR